MSGRFRRICHVGHGKLGFRLAERGRGLGWPTRGERRFVTVWNWLACRIVGHEHTLRGIPDILDADGTYPCTACRKRFRGESTPSRRHA